MSTTDDTRQQPPHDELVDVRDMIVVHTALLREFRLAPVAVIRTGPGDRRQVRAVAAHLTFVCDLLRHHHRGEDDLLWPLLRDRAPTGALAAIEEAGGQHLAIEGVLSEVGARLTDWVDDPDTNHGELLAGQLERLFALLRDHLDLEERSLLPLAALVLTRPEWQAVGAAGAAAVPKRLLPLTFGMFAYEGDPGVVTDMLREAPLLPRLLLPLIAPRLYARRARSIHGTSRP